MHCLGVLAIFCSVVVGVLSALQQDPLKVAGAGFRKAADEDVDEVLPAERLRHEFPSLAGTGIAGEGGFDQRWKIELGFHGFHEVFDGVFGTALARLFFFDFADGVVNPVASGVRKGVEEFQEAFGFGEFAGEGRVDGHGDGKTITRMTRIERIFTDQRDAIFMLRTAFADRR